MSFHIDSGIMRLTVPVHKYSSTLLDHLSAWNSEVEDCSWMQSGLQGHSCTEDVCYI